MSAAALPGFLTPRRIAATVLAVAGATLAGALASENLFGLLPCKLCLQQRWPYYIGVPLAAATVMASGRWLRVGLLGLALLFAVSAGLGSYHAGVEWGLFAGPTDCDGGAAPVPGSMGHFLQTLERARVVSCTEAAWRMLGLSLAGWNALISLGLAGLAGWAAIDLLGRARGVTSPETAGPHPVR